MPVVTPPVRPRRADARRNREAILAAAQALFETDGIYASIDGIAAAAGVGNATLYRNFPTRDDLLAAVMEERIAGLLDESHEFERNLQAGDALREWLYRLAWHMRIWHDLPTCIAMSLDNADSPVQDVATRLIKRTGHFLHHARDQEVAVEHLAAEDLFQLVTAVSWGLDRFGDDPERARHRVGLATAGVFRNPHCGLTA